MKGILDDWLDYITGKKSRYKYARYKRVMDFLEVESQEMKPVTFKQAREKLRKLIANYYELKEKFNRTGWARYFED